MNTFYIIASHVAYHVPRLSLVKSMREHGVHSSRTCVVIGGAEQDLQQTIDGVATTFVTHNSYDFTGMIALVEGSVAVPSDCTHLVFLHDTMLFGPRSDYLFTAAPSGWWAVSADQDAACNLVRYSRGYIAAQSVSLLALKNCSKQTAIDMERHFWRACQLERRAKYANARCDTLGEGTPYGETRRLREYYPAVDITKWKANWGANSNYTHAP